MEQVHSANRIRVHRPTLTEEERLRRLECIRRAAADAVLAARRREEATRAAGA